MINTRDLHTFIEEFPLKTGGPQPTTFGTCVVTYEIKRYTDLRNLGDALKYRVLCTQRIIIPNASQFALGPQNISEFDSYPAAVSNTITVKNTGDGVAADLLNYTPKTVNAAVMTSNSSSTGSTQSNSIQHSSGSSTSQSNSFDVSANLGFFGLSAVGGVSMSHDHTSTSGRYSGSATGAQSGGETQSQDSSSMSIKDWGCYSYLDPSNSSPTWVWGQEYPWNVIQYNYTDTENPSSSNAIRLPNFVQALLCDANQALPPSQLSLFGIDFTMKALWDTTPDSSGRITVTHTINYSTATHSFASANKVSAMIATPVSASYTSPDLDLTLLGLDPIANGSAKNGAVMGFIPSKFVVAPAAGAPFKILSDANNLQVTGAGFDAPMTTTFSTAVNLTVQFKVVDDETQFALFMKHWKITSVGCTLSFVFNGDTQHPVVRRVDAGEGGGGEDNLTTITLRNRDYTSVDYHDYLVKGLNTVKVTITPDAPNAGYLLRALAIGET